MGFSGGGSNVLLPHTHDGRVAQDGGPLNFSNITQSQSAAGQVFYSDGVALQQLSIGAANDELRVNAGATAPEWYTPTSAAVWTLVGSVTVATTASDMTVTPTTPIDASVAQTRITFSCASASAQDIQMTINGSSAAAYDSIGQYNQGVVTSFSASGATKWELLGGTSGTADGSTGVVILNVQDDGGGNDYIIGNSNCFTDNRLDMLSLKYTTSQSTITEINLTPKGAVDWTAGSTMSVYTLSK